MFGIGGMELLVILVVGVVVLGPERLPRVMRSFTKVMSEFRRISTDLQRTINSEINLQEFNDKQRRENKKIARKPKKEPLAGSAAAKSKDATPVEEARPAANAAAPEAAASAPALGTPAPEAPVNAPAPVTENEKSVDKA